MNNSKHENNIDSKGVASCIKNVSSSQELTRQSEDNDKIRKSPSDFLFLAELGEGSFSTVHLAAERSTHRQFAIKVCHKKQIVRERKIQQIYREKDALKRLSEKPNCHPFIVQIYCTFQDSESLYIVMTVAKGGDLLSKLKKYKKFSLDLTRFYSSEIVSALSHMHNLKIIHRDLKPENILLSENGHILISDFGSSKLLDVPDRVFEEPIGRKRRCSFVGTAQYVSPEVLNGEPVGPECDYWALGVIIYQLLTGQLAFHDESEYLIYQKILKADFTYPGNFPVVAQSFVSKLIVVKTEERLGSSRCGGSDAVKKHEFFDSVIWDNLINVQPPPFE